MELHELNRMFDALAPTPEQEQDGLNRLLTEERKAIMKKPAGARKTLRAALIAAAVCAVLLGTVFAAGEFTRITLQDQGEQDGLPWMKYQADIAEYSVSLFSSSVQDWSAEHPDYGYDVYAFDSLEQAEEFAGITLRRNPLLETGPVSVTLSRWEPGTGSMVVSFDGVCTANGHDAFFVAQAFVGEDSTYYTTFSEDASITTVEYVMEKSGTAALFTLTEPEDSSWKAMSVEFVLDGMLCSIEIFSESELPVEDIQAFLDAY